MTEVTSRDMAIMTYLLAFPLQCFYCDQKIVSYHLIMSVAEFRTVCHPGRARSKTATRNPCRRFLDAPEQIKHRAWKHLLLMNRSSFWGTWDNWDSDTEASLQKTNSAEVATFAIQYSHRCILQDVNVSDSNHPRIFQDIRNFSPFQNSPRSPERKQSLIQRSDVLRRSQAGTAGKPNWSPSAYDESSNQQVVGDEKNSDFFFNWMDEIVMSMIFPNKTS